MGTHLRGNDLYGDMPLSFAVAALGGVIAVPIKLNAEQREKLDTFAKSLGEQTSPMEESFFEKAKKFFR